MRDTSPGEEETQLFEDAQWGQNGDGTIDEKEFISGYMSVWDDNGDGEITDEEWQTSADLLP